MSEHGEHHGPSNFFTKYVFSTDHKVIGIQFTFTALLFVILGGLLALGVRYQLAWPSQHVPYNKLLPGKMTSRAPEANLALWQVGCGVELKEAIDGVEAKATLKLADFPKGLAVTVPVGTVVENEAGRTRTLDQPLDAWVDHRVVMGTYHYAKQEAMTTAGQAVTVPALGDQPARRLVLVGVERLVLDASGQPHPQADGGPIYLPVRAAQTPVRLTDAGGGGSASLEINTTADKVSFYKETLTTDAYTQLFTMHASIMIFFVIIPMLVGGFGNFLIPLMVGGA